MSNHAFPPSIAYHPNPRDGAHMVEGAHGMTLRDYFAAKAMHAAVTCPTAVDSVSDESVAFDECAAWAYKLADAMLKARSA